MAYATQTDLIERFGEQELVELTDRTHVPPTTVDAVAVSRAVGDASALIDGYLGKVYALPLATTPANLVRAAADIARYYLHGKAADKDSAVTRAFNEALAWLKDVGRGLVQLDVGGGEPAPAADNAGRVTGSEPVFTRASLRGF